MHAADVIAYTLDGEIYCPDCFDDDDANPEIGAVFADNADDTIGSTCGTCGSCFAPTRAIGSPDWITDAADECRWSRCAHCNSQRPHAKDDSRVRLAARRGQLRCTSCGRPDVHF